MRLARATGGGVEYWLTLPLHELLQFMLELSQQIAAENEALKKGR